MTSRIYIASALALLGFGLGQSSILVANERAQSRSVYSNLWEKRKGLAKSLARRAAHCVERPDTDHFAFRGCIDWHSSVHGNWALLTYARRTGDVQYLPRVGKLLTQEAIAAERAFLKRRPDFERPYGRAWFLRLAIAQKRTLDRDDLAPMAQDVMQSLLAHYRQNTPRPTSRSYNSASWALINMWDYAEETGNMAVQQQVRTWVQKHFARPGATCRPRQDGRSFMAVCTNWAWLVSRALSQEDFSDWLGTFFGRKGPPQPVKRPRNWHHYGLNFSRAWGLWALYEKTGNETYRSAYADHVTAGLAAAKPKLNNYRGLGHWIPQFALLAIDPLFETKNAP